MTTPAFADAGLATLARDEHAPPAVAVRPDVLFVLNNLGIGGSERKIVRLTNRLKNEGVHVSIACLNGPFTIEPGLGRDVPLCKLERKGKFSLRALLRLRRMIARERPRTVIAVNLYQALYVAFACMFSRYRPRTVALVNTSTFRGHHVLKRMYQSVLARLDHTVHGSQAQRAFWFRAGCTAWANSSVIYNGVDSDHFEVATSRADALKLRASLGVAPESLLIGTVGRLAPEKNQEVLLATLRRLREAGVDANLLLAGNGPLADSLKRRATELRIAERVHFVGELEDVRPVLAALDVFVLPSIAVESFSNAALEAMSMGRPVILSNIGGAPEMIRDGVEGYVIPPAELAARLPTVLAALHIDRRKRQHLGAAARTRVVTCFSVPAMVAGYRGLLADGEAR